MAFIIVLLVMSLSSPALAGDGSLVAQVAPGDPMVADNAMSEDRFWALIALTTAHEAEPKRQLEALRQALSELTPSEIEAFERAFHRAQRKSYSWNLWGAAYVLNGGASDDGFEYFQ